MTAVWQTVRTVAEIAGSLLPDLIAWIKSLIDLGKSPSEAAEIVRRDIRSRVEEYEKAKAADEAALEAKYGREDESE